LIEAVKQPLSRFNRHPLNTPLEADKNNGVKITNITPGSGVSIRVTKIKAKVVESTATEQNIKIRLV
jgi:hypothetical protein